MKNLLCTLVTLYVIVLVLRIVLSWFPTAPGSVVEQINRVLRAATDPLLLPLRRVIPPMGGLDLSALILLLFLQVVVQRGLLRC